MPIVADYHLHTYYSGDSESPMETQILSALDRGLKYICFTDHYDPFFPYDRNPDVEPGTFELDYSAYHKEFLLMKDKYKGKIGLFFGIELGLQAHLPDFLTKYLSGHRDLDFIIGSNHLCGGFDPYYPAFLSDRTEEEALCLYLEESLNNLRSFSDIDSCGHLDYVVRYLPHRESLYSYQKFSDWIDPILRFILDKGIALEVNTSPLIKGMRYFNPLPDILAKYRELGGELITIGSDAHVPEKVAGYFDETAGVLRDLGFRYYAVYENRKPRMLSL